MEKVKVLKNGKWIMMDEKEKRKNDIKLFLIIILSLSLVLMLFILFSLILPHKTIMDKIVFVILLIINIIVFNLFLWYGTKKYHYPTELECFIAQHPD